MDHHKATIHDGERVRLELQDKDIAHIDFGRGMEWDISKVSRMLRQESWKTADLARAGAILMCNFFMEYQTGGPAPIAFRYGKMKATLQVSMDVDLNPEAYLAVNKQFEEVLDTIRPVSEPPDK